MKLSDPLSLTEARRIAIRLYVEMTRRGWREKWTSHQVSKIARLITDSWDDPVTTDEGRWNMFTNIMYAWVYASAHLDGGPVVKLRIPEPQEDGIDV